MKHSGVAVAGAAALMIGAMSVGTGGPAAAAAGHHRALTPAASPVGALLTLASASSGAVIARVKLVGVPEQITMPSSGSAAYVTGYMPGPNGPGSDRLVAYKITPGRPVRVTRIADSLSALTLAISPDGRTLYLADPEITRGGRALAKIVPVSTSTGKTGRPVQVHGLGPYLENLAVAPDNKTIYAVTDNKRLAAIRISSGKVIGRPIRIGPRKAPPFTAVQKVIFSRSGKLLYVLSAEGRYSLLTVINARTGREIGSAHAPGSLVSQEDIAVTPDGRLVYVISTPRPATPWRRSPSSACGRR